MKRPEAKSAVTPMDQPMSRRAALRTFTTVGVALAAFLAARRVTADRTDQPYTVTVNAKIRSGPGQDHEVVSVIPKGAPLAISTPERDTFQGVAYNGQEGWVYAPLIVAANAPGDPSLVGEATTAAAAHLRSGPGEEHTVLRVVASGAPLNVSNTVQNGFRYVVHRGLAGWMADRCIAWRAGHRTRMTTIANLNLRDEPGTSANVLRVIPSDATVIMIDEALNGFRKVTYDGTVGWVAEDYLR